MHDRYGPVVRVTPNELSFCHKAAWKEIYGSRPGGELSKHYDFYQVDDALPQYIISAGKARYGLLRRLLAQGFSEQTLKTQQPVIREFINLFLARSREHGDEGARITDLNMWFNYATFDIIGKLTFGVDFENVKKSDWHPWVKASPGNNRTVGIMAAANGVGLGPLIRWCIRN